MWSFTPDLLSAPTISNVSASNTITITDANSLPTGYTIRYTTGNGSQAAPTATIGTVYNGPINVEDNWTVKAVVVRYGIVLTEVVTKAVSPVIVAPTVTNNGDGTISLSTVTSGATIYYTTDGNDPDNNSNPYANTPFTLGNATVIKAIAYLGSEHSEVTTYNVPLYTTPTISFDYTTSQVTITSNGSVYYNTGDGSQANPTTSSTAYSAPFTVTSNTVVKAIATHAGYLASETATQAIITEPSFQYITGFSYVYDGTEKEPIDYLEYSSTTIPSTAYLLTYTNNTNAGTATVTITDSGVDDGFIVYGSTTFTITQKAITITADSDTKGYDGTPLTNDGYTCSPGLATGDSFASVTVTGSQTNVGSSNNVPSDAVIKNGSNEVMTGNYAITYANGTLTVTEKSIGNGTNPALGFTVSIGEGNTIILKDGETTLEQGIPNDDEKDFIISSETTSTKYSTRTITGKGNYSGSFTVRNAIVSFQTDANEREWSATFAAEGADPSNPDSNEGHELPSGITAYIITDIDRDWVIPEALNYIPEGVPVLLLSKEACEGFFVQDASGHTAITPAQISSNMLEETASTTHFNVRTIYLLHNNEFVYNIDGDLAAGKVYLNPNHSGGGGGGSGARLQIMWDTDTGIEDYSISIIHHAPLNDVWYTLDGCRLSGKPTKKGLYLCNGQKAVVR